MSVRYTNDLTPGITLSRAIALAMCLGCHHEKEVVSPCVRPAGNSQLECDPPESKLLDLELFPQESSMLCWAGVTEMLATYFDKNASQCDQVQSRDPGCQCVGCQASAAAPPGPCNTGGWPDFCRIGSARQLKDKALDLLHLKREIACGERPVVFSWKTGETSAHIMIAYGYQGDWIEVADPWPACTGARRVIDYETYVTGGDPERTSHWHDFYGISPSPGGP
jgi:hypothetical protein